MSNKLAFVFPGQGSQTIGMLAALGEQYPIVKQTFDTSSSVLGYDLWELIQQGPEQRLNDTAVTQPALLTASYAIWCVWLSRHGRVPDFVAGHSLGEYTALVCAEAIDFPTGVDLVAKRGRYMTEAMAGQIGSMAAIIGLENAKVLEICQQVTQQQNVAIGHGHGVAPANYNSHDQIVIAGDDAAINRAIELANQADARLAMKLAVSVPCHCALMKPAAEKLASALASAQIQTPKIPVIHNVDVSLHSEPEQIRAALIQQLYSPVRWVESVEKLIASGVTSFIECGPGKVLTGLIKRVDRSLAAVAIGDPENLEKAVVAH